MRRKIIEKSTILLAERGSFTYGTQISDEDAQAYGLEPSDKDVMRVIMSPLSDLFSLGKPFKAATYSEPYDEEVHELRHFLGLCAKANPNILECLAVDDEHVIQATEEGRLLRDSLPLFLAKRPVANAYMGYTQHQIRRYIDRPDGRPPLERRSDLWERFDYDIKAASHALRLLIQGRNALLTGELKARLEGSDLSLVRSVRLGLVPKADIMPLLNEYIHQFREAEGRSELPDRPDMAKITHLYRRLCEMRYALEGRLNV